MSGYPGDSTNDYWRHVRQREQTRPVKPHRSWLRRLGHRIYRAARGQ